MHRRYFLTLTAGTMLAMGAGGCGSVVRDGRTASDVEGPYYPVEPIPVRSDLIADERVVGDELRLSGRIADVAGSSLSGVRIEIWQCDGNRVYRHPRAPKREHADAAFLGFGAQITAHQGRYAFRTIVPVPYGGRPPHIHVKLWRANRELLTTQLYVHGYRGANDRQIQPLQRGDYYDASFDFLV